MQRRAILLADLGFGDAGKGTITDFLAREYSAHTIVRYNGGPQAAHNVVTPDGRHHTFAQFGSGMFVPSTRTLLSRFMLVNPLNLLKEARHLSVCGVPNALARLLVDRRARVITPFQRALNRLRETARGAERHGSCGEGVGECMADALAFPAEVLVAGDLQDRSILLKKLRFVRDLKQRELETLLPLLPATPEVLRERALFTDDKMLEECARVYQHVAEQVTLVDDRAIGDLFEQPGTLLFEGAQGVLLDENYGFAPYTTWSTTTFANAEALLQESGYAGETTRLGILRTYATRHGAGPFPTEETALTELLPERHNGWNDWQRTFRVGYSDLVMLRYAVDLLGKLDGLAVTHLDALEALPEWKLCAGYRYMGSPATREATDGEHQSSTTSRVMASITRAGGGDDSRLAVEPFMGERDELSDFFTHTGKQLHTMKVRFPPDLAHQEQLTRYLWKCEPEYLTVQSQGGEPVTGAARNAGAVHFFTTSRGEGAERGRTQASGHPQGVRLREETKPAQNNGRHPRSAYLSLLAERLATPVVLVSSGPSAREKQFLQKVLQ